MSADNAVLKGFGITKENIKKVKLPILRLLSNTLADATLEITTELVRRTG